MCSVEGCDRAAKVKGLCQMHYMRQRRHGDPATVEKAGRKADEGYVYYRRMFREFNLSQRTRARIFPALRGLKELVGIDKMKKIISYCSRPSGSTNFSKVEAIFKRLENMAAMLILDAEDRQEDADEAYVSAQLDAEYARILDEEAERASSRARDRVEARAARESL